MYFNCFCILFLFVIFTVYVLCSSLVRKNSLFQRLNNKSKINMIIMATYSTLTKEYLSRKQRVVSYVPYQGSKSIKMIVNPQHKSLFNTTKLYSNTHTHLLVGQVSIKAQAVYKAHQWAWEKLPAKAVNPSNLGNFYGEI